MPKGQYKREANKEVMERARLAALHHYQAITLQLYLVQWTKDAIATDKIRDDYIEKFGSCALLYPSGCPEKRLNILRQREGAGWGHAYYLALREASNETKENSNDERLDGPREGDHRQEPATA